MNKILPLFELPEFANYQGKYCYPDTPTHCVDKEYFNSYPYRVFYSFNSRGYRGDKWPADIEELKKSIWCIGDSGTTGLGAPIEHSWPYILSQMTGKPCINISLKGASNFWIARQVEYLLDNLPVENIVVSWTFLHRRELPETDVNGKVPDSERLSIYPCLDYKENIKVTLDLISNINTKKQNENIVHTFVPEYLDEENKRIFPVYFKTAVKQDFIKIKQIDLARDSRHWDVKTSTGFCEDIISRIV
jgi:hypothetical protein